MCHLLFSNPVGTFLESSHIFARDSLKTQTAFDCRHRSIKVSFAKGNGQNQD